MSKRINDYVEELDYDETIEKLKELYDKGYRYVVRGPIEAFGSSWLDCFNIKPKKYKSLDIWGYYDTDINQGLPVVSFCSNALPEIKWTNRSPKLILEVIQ